jgi:hypothetical protein
MENIVVIASSEERTKKLIKQASVIAKKSGTKVWLVYDLQNEEVNKGTDINRSTGLTNNNSYSDSLNKSNQDHHSKLHLEELKKHGIAAELLFFKKMNMKRFLEKVLINQIILENPDFAS